MAFLAKAKKCENCTALYIFLFWGFLPPCGVALLNFKFFGDFSFKKITDPRHFFVFLRIFFVIFLGKNHDQPLSTPFGCREVVFRADFCRP